MELVRGYATRVTRSAEVVEHNDGPTVSQIVSCQVGDRAVQISMTTLPNIHDGDEVIVAGWSKQGTLIARGYYNLTTGSYGRWSYDPYLLFVTLPIVIGVSFVLPPVLLASVPYSCWRWYDALRTRKAYRAVHAAAKMRTALDQAPALSDIEPPDRRRAPPAEEPVELPPELPDQVWITCPECGKRVKLNRTLLGRRVRCPVESCRTVFDSSACAD